jgi:hypothetical protein
MPEFGIGALGYVGYGKESVEGTAVAPTKFIPATSVSFPDSNDYLSPLDIRGSRDIVLALPAPYTIEGSIEMSGQSHDVGNLLMSAFAATVSTSNYSGGGYSHVLTPANSATTMTFEVSPGGTNDLIMRYSGCRVNTFEIKASFGEIVMWTVGIDGIDRAQHTGAAASPSYHAQSVYPWHFNGAKVQIGGTDSAIVKEFTFGVNNNIEHIGTLRRTRAYKRVALGPREMSLSMSLDFTDDTEYERMLDDDEFAVQLYFENGQDLTGNPGDKVSLTIDLPRVKYRTVGLPMQASDFLTQDVECTVLKPVGAAIATVTLVNNENNAALIS